MPGGRGGGGGGSSSGGGGEEGVAQVHPDELRDDEPQKKMFARENLSVLLRASVHGATAEDILEAGQAMSNRNLLDHVDQDDRERILNLLKDALYHTASFLNTRNMPFYDEAAAPCQEVQALMEGKNKEQWVITAWHVGQLVAVDPAKEQDAPNGLSTCITRTRFDALARKVNSDTKQNQGICAEILQLVTVGRQYYKVVAFSLFHQKFSLNIPFYNGAEVLMKTLTIETAPPKGKICEHHHNKLGRLKIRVDGGAQVTYPHVEGKMPLAQLHWAVIFDSNRPTYEIRNFTGGLPTYVEQGGQTMEYNQDNGSWKCVISTVGLVDVKNITLPQLDPREKLLDPNPFHSVHEITMRGKNMRGELVAFTMALNLNEFNTNKQATTYLNNHKDNTLGINFCFNKQATAFDILNQFVAGKGTLARTHTITRFGAYSPYPVYILNDQWCIVLRTYCPDPMQPDFKIEFGKICTPAKLGIDIQLSFFPRHPIVRLTVFPEVEYYVRDAWKRFVFWNYFFQHILMAYHQANYYAAIVSIAWLVQALQFHERLGRVEGLVDEEFMVSRLRGIEILFMYGDSGASKTGQKDLLKAFLGKHKHSTVGSSTTFPALCQMLSWHFNASPVIADDVVMSRWTNWDEIIRMVYDATSREAAYGRSQHPTSSFACVTNDYPPDFAKNDKGQPDLALLGRMLMCYWTGKRVVMDGTERLNAANLFQESLPLMAMMTLDLMTLGRNHDGSLNDKPSYSLSYFAGLACQKGKYEAWNHKLWKHSGLNIYYIVLIIASAGKAPLELYKNTIEYYLNTIVHTFNASTSAMKPLNYFIYSLERIRGSGVGFNRIDEHLYVIRKTWEIFPGDDRRDDWVCIKVEECVNLLNLHHRVNLDKNMLDDELNKQQEKNHSKVRQTQTYFLLPAFLTPNRENIPMSHFESAGCIAFRQDWYKELAAGQDKERIALSPDWHQLTFGQTKSEKLFPEPHHPADNETVLSLLANGTYPGLSEVMDNYMHSPSIANLDLEQCEEYRDLNYLKATCRQNSRAPSRRSTSPAPSHRSTSSASVLDITHLVK